MDEHKTPDSTPAPAATPTAAVSVASPSVERNWAMGAHLSALLGLVLPFGNVIGPLIVWLVKKNESPLVDREGKESLNFQISMTIYMCVSAILIFVLIGVPLLFGLAVADLILTIVAAVKTSNGENYKYPLTLRLLS